MNFKECLDGLRAWFESRELFDVTFEEGLGQDGGITAITFPIEEEDGCVSYDMIATVEDGGDAFFYVDYCDIPEVDELELLRYVNGLNQHTPFTVAVEDGRLCFSYVLPFDLIASSESLAYTFFDLWDSIDEIKEDIHDAFGIERVILDEDAEEQEPVLDEEEYEDEENYLEEEVEDEEYEEEDADLEEEDEYLEEEDDESFEE